MQWHGVSSDTKVLKEKEQGKPKCESEKSHMCSWNILGYFLLPLFSIFVCVFVQSVSRCMGYDRGLMGDNVYINKRSSFTI